jgi:hypothetical protein
MSEQLHPVSRRVGTKHTDDKFCGACGGRIGIGSAVKQHLAIDCIRHLRQLIDKMVTEANSVPLTVTIPASILTHPPRNEHLKFHDEDPP